MRGIQSAMNMRTRRLIGIVVIGCVAIGAVAFFAYPEFFALPQAGQPLSAVVHAPKSSAESAAKGNESPRMPDGSVVSGQVMRDLFAPPTGYAALLAAQPKGSGQQASNGGRAFSHGPIPVLTGVIQGDGVRVAILRQGAISRSYRVGQASGEYRVVEIGENSVTLAGPSGTTVLTMGK